MTDETVPTGLNQNEQPQPDKSFLKRLGDWLRARNGETARDALEDLIDEPEHGEISLGPDERLLMGNILGLQGQTIADVMVPRADIVATKTSTSLTKLVKLIANKGHSRVPLYKKSLDDAFAMVHVKDILTWQGQDKDFDVTSIARAVLFVAPSMHVLELLLEMRVKRVHMAFVVDEYGGVDGLVTIEDLVEEIVGEIQDEHEPDDDAPGITRLNDITAKVDARLPIDDLNDQMDLDLPEDQDYDTVGGFVFAELGHIPEAGEAFEAHGIKVTVDEAQRTKVLSVGIFC